MGPSAMTTPDYIDADDQRLVQRAQDGELAAFNAIVERHQKHAYNLALFMLRDPGAAEDATQEAFFSAYRAIERFNGGNLQSWLLTIVANRCRDALRSPQRRRSSSLEAVTEAGDPGGIWRDPGRTPEEAALVSETVSQVHDALAQLPEDQRLIISLVDLQGMDYEEAARITNVSLGTVKSRLSRGRDRLRTVLRPILELSGDLPRPDEGKG